ncbi:MAG: DUF475 domain-containing protein [Patescibacteria group bacterium]
MLTILLTVGGLILFEVINSIDNAVINAEVLGKMSPWARRFFLVWGILLGVFLVRGLLPWLIVWLATPGITIMEAFKASFSSDPSVMTAVETAAPILLVGAGIFLLFLFLHWLFLEDKEFGLMGERFIAKHGLWFYTLASFILVGVVWAAVKTNAFIALGAVIGSSAFFLIHGLKENAEATERRMMEGETRMSDWSKILYLEVIDACFSIDGVVGAFAFTMSVPLILIGNGIGAVVVRQLTIGNIERIKKFKYLKNGAMYSIAGLGTIMLLDGFGIHIPAWVSPVVTFIIVGYFFMKSVRANRV